MKNCLLLLSFIISLTTISAQDKIQWSTVREQNSNKRPIPNAQVIFSDAPPASSDQSGKLRLAFKGKKPGIYVFLTEVQKAGYELVNNKEIEQVKLSEGDQLGVDIILAKAGFVEASKKEYYGISDKSLKAGFEREKAKLRADLQASRVTAEQFEKEKTQLEKEYERQQKELDALADKFARVNFDDVSPVYKEALESFKAGKIDEAITKLESVNPTKRTEAIIKEQKRIANAQAELDSQKVALEKEKRQQIANLRLLADMYSLKFDPVKAETQYDDLLRLDSTDLTVLIDAAYFYQNNLRYDKALKTYLLIVANPRAEEWQSANAQCSMGEIHTDIGDLPAALDAYTKYFEKYQKLHQDNPTDNLYKHNLAISYLKICETHKTLGNINKALAFLGQSNHLEKELNTAFPQNVVYQNALAVTYQLLGSLHEILGNLDTALVFFGQFNRLEKELYTAFPQNANVKNNLARSYRNLGNLHSIAGNLDSSLFFLQHYKTLANELYTAFPQNIGYKHLLAISYRFLGTTHSYLGNVEKALAFFEQYNNLEKELYAAFPQNVDFKNELAISYEKLGAMQSVLGDFDKAFSFFEQYNHLEKELNTAFPQDVNIKIGLAISYEKLGSTYTSLGNLAQALTFFEQYNNLEKEFHAAYPQQEDFKNGLAVSYERLGTTHISLGNLEQVLPFFEQYNQLAKELYAANPQNSAFKDGLAISYAKLGYYYIDKKMDVPKAHYYFSQCQLLWQELTKSHPAFPNYTNNLAWVDKAILELDDYNDPVFRLQKRIDNELDSLIQYQLYSILCDSLRQRAFADPQHKTALAEAINNWAWLGLFLKKFEAVEANVKEGMALKTDDKFLVTNLAPALLFQGKRMLAIAEYQKWKDKPFGEQDLPTYREAFLEDLKAFEQAGIIPPERKADVEAVRKLLNEPKKK